jgi:hypothetical protein
MFARDRSPIHGKIDSLVWLCLILLLVLPLTACERIRETPPPPAGTYPVDPLFRAYYENHGGEKVFGPAISPLFRKEENFYQYTVSALLMYDSAADEQNRIRLSQLGQEIGHFELPAGGVPQPGERYVDGYKLFDKFVDLYDQIGGEQVVGRPRTEAQYNQEKQRYVQYFDNVGFFWIEGDAEDAAHLLSLGSQVCGSYCAYEPAIIETPELPTGSTPPSIRIAVAKLGLDFTGFPLSPPINSSGGMVEQLYENVKFIVHPDHPDAAELYPLPEELGYLPEPPRQPNPMPDMLFVPVGENLGYNVPQVFVDYIRDHGDFDFTGAPITHPNRLETGAIEQCFKNICLQGNYSAEGEAAVKPLPLGVEYLKATGPVPTPVGNLTDITIQVWERYPLISSDLEQEIGVVAMGGGKPLENALVDVTVGMPDGSDQIYRLAPTDENGETSLKLTPIEAQNGTLIQYRACLSLPESQQFCVMDAFIIWQTPVEPIPTVMPEKTSYLPFIVRNFRMYIPALIDAAPTYLPLIFNNP